MSRTPQWLRVKIWKKLNCFLKIAYFTSEKALARWGMRTVAFNVGHKVSTDTSFLICWTQKGFRDSIRNSSAARAMAAASSMVELASSSRE